MVPSGSRYRDNHLSFNQKGGLNLKRNKASGPPMLRPKLGRNYKSPYSANVEDRVKVTTRPSIGNTGAPLRRGAYVPPVARPRDWRDAPKAPTPVPPRTFSCPECKLTSEITKREQNHVEGCAFDATVRGRRFRAPAPPTYHIQKMHIKMVKGAHAPEPKVEMTPFWERFKNDGQRQPALSEDDLKRKSPPFGR